MHYATIHMIHGDVAQRHMFSIQHTQCNATSCPRSL